MIISERVTGGHVFEFDTETKILSVDECDPDKYFKIDITGIKTLQNMFKFLDDNKLM